MSKSDNKNLPAPTWSAAQRQQIIAQLGQGRKYAWVYKYVTSDQFTADTGVAKLDPFLHSLQSFRERVKKIPAEVITKEFEKWQADLSGIHWAEEKARLQGLSDLVDKLLEDIDNTELVTESTLDTINSVRRLMEQIRRERNTDFERMNAASGSAARMMLSNPRYVNIDSELIVEWLLTFMHLIKIETLTIQQLTQLQPFAERLLLAFKAAVNKIPETPIERVDPNDTDKK